ncbi:hypothetical protein IL306_009351 [Fusarium sp. DS 682]|nr:hypothetical protein IL306_009351 [Fusarium sp. DS 682]
MSEPCIEDYTIGWICALQEEYEAACRMLDDEFDGPETSDANDNNTYVFGRISDHNVVIGCLPDGRYGISSAAVVARDMVRSFPSLRFALMVGIGGGAPTPERDIRLGDVVVSIPQGKLGGVIQYDFGKRLSNGRFQQTSQLNSPPEVLLGAIPEMRRRHNDPRKPDRVSEHLRLMEDMPEYQRPEQDRLYRAAYEHPGGKDFLSSLDTKVNQLSDGVQDMRFRQLNQEHQAILDWLIPFDYGTQQSDYFGSRQQGTGQWFLESTEYREWRNADGKTLFCPGIPGAGKTIISSIIINDLHTELSDNPSIGIGYIYCNFRRHQEQNINDLLASLLKQLSRSWHCLPESVKSLYAKHENPATRPLVDELSAALQSVVELYDKVFIVIDALDECQTLDDCRGKLLSEIFSLQSRFTVNLFATSRPVSDITTMFDRALCLAIRATKDDVTLYLEKHIGTLRFLLAHIYLQYFKDKVTENDVRSALEGIQKRKQASRGDKNKLLSSAYDQVMERIERQEIGLRELAIRVLSWITCAKRQLTTIELQHALATKTGKRVLDNGDLVPIDDVVSVCAGLVTVDKESNIVRLAHYTTQDYLEDKRNELFPFVESDMLITCVNYMLFDAFDSGFCHTVEEFEERMRLYPFYNYSACHWGDHAREAPTLCQEAIDFLDSTTKVESSSQALMVAERSRGRNYSQDVPSEMRGLHLAAYLGMKDAVQILSMRSSVNYRDGYGRIALSYAIMRGNGAIVKLLLDTGQADVNARDQAGRTPLLWAAMGGQEAIVKLLLDIDTVDVDAPDANGYTPLSWAADRGYEAIVEMLLDTGKVNVCARDQIWLDSVIDGHIGFV